ncbi:MAG: hypothetical protein QM724_06495 [Flavobacteriales bacterium]
MTARNTSTWALALLAGLSLFSCGGNTDQGQGGTPTADTLDTAQHADGGVVKVGGMLFGIPSPLQTALLIRKSGAAYAKDMPLSTDAAAKFTAKQQRALALGLYGADLAYVTIHKDGQRALKTLQTIEQLSGQLELSNAFDKALVDRFKKSLNNEDSLLRLTGTAYRAADSYLKANERNDVSAWVLAGGWVEGLYLTIGQPGAKLDQAVMDHIGEQKRSLDNLVLLLERTDTDKSATALVASLKALQGAYSGISSTYTYQQPTTDAAKKTTFINSVTTTTISAEQVRAIGEQVKAIRSTIIA